MYQSVDDPDDIDLTEAEERAERRAGVWKAVIVAVAILALVTIFSVPRAPKPAPSDTAKRAEAANYRTAISEPNKALRRARLTDFQTTYPDSDRQPAVSAQLLTIAQYETKAWAKVTAASFEPELSNADKLAAIAAYERDWGQSYLGSREAEIARIKESLNSAPDIPSRKLAPGPSPIPKSIPDGSLLGGPAPVAPKVTRPAPITRPAPEAAPKVAVFVPKILRNVTPRYPRRAQRRGVEGFVELSLGIDDTGRVRLTDVVDARADDPRYARDFIKAAERAARRTRYAPFVENGQPKPRQGIIKRYRFKMN